jgi:chromosome partitioning protein
MRPEGAGYTCVALNGRAVLTEVRRLAPKYQDVVIDTSGSNMASQRGALTAGDLCLVPFAPRSFDIWTLHRVVAVLEEARAVNPGLRACAFLNRADPRGGDNAAAAEILKSAPRLELIPIALGGRKNYARAATEGLSVAELRPPDPKRSRRWMRSCASSARASAGRRRKSPAQGRARRGGQ